MRAFERVFKIAFVLFMVISLGSWVAAEESQQIEKKDVPADVIKAFIEAYPGTKVTGIEKEEIEGKIYYEFECRQGETEKDVIYLEDGSLFAIEEEIAIDALPQAVMDAVMKAYPDGEIDEAEKITRGSDIEYEVAIEIEEADEEMEYEVIITSDGQIISAEQDQDEDDDDGEDDDEEDEDDPDDIHEDDDEDDN